MNYSVPSFLCHLCAGNRHRVRPRAYQKMRRWPKRGCDRPAEKVRRLSEEDIIHARLTSLSIKPCSSSACCRYIAAVCRPSVPYAELEAVMSQPTTEAHDRPGTKRQGSVAAAADDDDNDGILADEKAGAKSPGAGVASAGTKAPGPAATAPAADKAKAQDKAKKAKPSSAKRVLFFLLSGPVLAALVPVLVVSTAPPRSLLSVLVCALISASQPSFRAACSAMVFCCLSSPRRPQTQRAALPHPTPGVWRVNRAPRFQRRAPRFLNRPPPSPTRTP